MDKLEKFKAVVRNFEGFADFVLLYVEEAHPYEREHIRGPGVYEIGESCIMSDSP